jgi:hypothetical protein
MNSRTARVAHFHVVYGMRLDIPRAACFLGCITLQFGDTLLPFYSEDQLMNQVTSWTILIAKPIVAQLLNKFHIFYGTQKFITGLQKPASDHYSEANYSNPHPPPSHLKSILIPSSHLCLGPTFDPFTLGFQPKFYITCISLFPHAR